jgi:osmotically inducible protein OsmC
MQIETIRREVHALPDYVGNVLGTRYLVFDFSQTKGRKSQQLPLSRCKETKQTTMKRTAISKWNGGFEEGKGTISTQSEVLKDQPYSAELRFENEDGTKGTNPEELIGAAHAGCYTMALSLELGKAGFDPDHLETKASVKLEKDGEGFSITQIHLNLEANVPEIDNDTFREVANAAKEGCPISKALSAVPIKLDAKLL